MAEGGSSMHMQPSDNWSPPEDHALGSRSDAEPLNGVPGSADDLRTGQAAPNPDCPRGSSADVSISGSKADTTYREKQVKPNKVYVGGLPEHTRQEDLQSCFGKIGNIVNIELKIGYGFVEFDTREAAEESVAKYHEGYFMGNKIRVELSRGGSRTAKYSSDPGACFKCGQIGHWARECPNHVPGGGSYRRSHNHSPHDAPLIDRIQPPKYPPPPPRDSQPYRDDLSSSRYARDPRYDYPPPPPSREVRRPVTPPRDYRDYPQGPPSRSFRDYDRDYKTRGPPPPHRYDSHSSYDPPDTDGPPSYPPRSYGPPPPPPSRELYDRYERRPPPPGDKYALTYPPSSARPRTPPGGPPPRTRDDYDRHRDYPPVPDYRSRPVSPPPSRYEYPPRPASPDIPAHRYRRRSGSPPPRSSATGPYDPVGYSGGSGSFTGNNYSNVSGGSVSGLPPRSRDYPSRSARDESGGSYRRPQ